jgi:hypothetical protein
MSAAACFPPTICGCSDKSLIKQFAFGSSFLYLLSFNTSSEAFDKIHASKEYMNSNASEVLP